MAGAYDDTVIIEDRCGRNPCSTVESDIKAFGEGRAGIPAESGRTDSCTFVDHSIYRRIL